MSKFRLQKTLFEYVQENNLEAAAKIVSDMICQGYESLVEIAFKNNNFEMVNLLVDHGSKIVDLQDIHNYLFQQGKLELLKSIFEDNEAELDYIKYFIEKGNCEYAKYIIKNYNIICNIKLKRKISFEKINIKDFTGDIDENDLMEQLKAFTVDDDNISYLKTLKTSLINQIKNGHFKSFNWMRKIVCKFSPKREWLINDIVADTFLDIEEGRIDKVLETIKNHNVKYWYLPGGFNLLHIACLYGQKELALDLIQAGVAIDAISRTEETSIIFAVKSGNIELVDLLSKYTQKYNLYKFMEIACENEDKEMLKYIFGANLSEEIEDYESTYPLSVAAKKNNLEMFQMMIEKGISTDNNDGINAMENAAINGNTDIFQILLDRKVDVNEDIILAAACNGQTDILYLVKDLFYQVVDESFLAKVISSKNNDGISLTINCLTMYSNPYPIIKAALENDFLNIAYHFAQSNLVEIPLDIELGLLAIEHGSKDTLKMLFQEGFDHLTEDDVSMFLHYACKFNRLKILMYLIANDFNVNVAGEILMEDAIKNKNIRMIRLLFKNDLKIENKTLICAKAIIAADIRIIKIFMDDINAIVHEGTKKVEFIIYAAMETQRSDVINYILEGAPDIEKYLIYFLNHACYEGSFDIVKQIVEYGIDFANDFCNPLVKAVYLDRKAIAQYLIEKGAIFDKDVFLGAVASANCKMCQMAIEHGVKPVLSNNSLYLGCVGNTSFLQFLYDLGLRDEIQEHCKDIVESNIRSEIDIIRFLVDHKIDISKYIDYAAFLSSSTGPIELTELLLKMGANPNYIFGGESMIFCAAQLGAVDMAELLLNYGAKPDGNALHAAYTEGNRAVLRLLMEHGTNPNLLSRMLYERKPNIEEILYQYGRNFDEFSYLIIGRPKCSILRNFRSSYEMVDFSLDRNYTNFLIENDMV